MNLHGKLLIKCLTFEDDLDKVRELKVRRTTTEGETERERKAIINI